MEIIKTENLSFWYPDSENPSIENINLSIKEGEFVVIVGPSGCGKSTLIRAFNRIVPDYYGGKVKGAVYLKGNNIRELNKEDIIKNVGMVYQHPEKQIVLQEVEREIAFGLENFNTNINKMKRNVSEVISLLAINDIRDKNTNEISGGQKQRVAIASVVAMEPEILIFDEPISQLDPIGAEEVLNCIKKLNRDMGNTVILVEQRLDKCFDMADRIIFMADGKIVAEGTPQDIPSNIDKKYFLPNISYIFKKAGYSKLPVNVKQARNIIFNDFLKGKSLDNINKEDTVQSNKNKDTSLSNANTSLKEKIFSLKEKFISPNKINNENAIEVEKINFEYKKGIKTVKNVSFSLKKGEILTVMGENGAGKSTLFKIITGIIDKYKGNVKISGTNIRDMDIVNRIKTIGYLSQNPNDYFGRNNVFDEVAYTLRNIDEFDEGKVNDMLEKLNITHLRNRNPRDLSGGEKQRTAIACTMISNPDILILDEPTRGMDAIAKENLGEIIKGFANEGKSVVLITHDADFAGDYSDRVMLMFNGEIVALGEAEDILYDSIYYAPQISKVFKNIRKVIKSEEAINLLR